MKGTCSESVHAQLRGATFDGLTSHSNKLSQHTRRERPMNRCLVVRVRSGTAGTVLVERLVGAADASGTSVSASRPEDGCPATARSDCSRLKSAYRLVG